MKWDSDINQKQKFDDSANEIEDLAQKTSTPASPEKPEPYVGVNWHVITKIGHIQFALACISSLALMLSLTCAGFSFYHLAPFTWSIYLLSTAYIAIRAGRRKSYAHVIVYCGMVTYQTVLYNYERSELASMANTSPKILLVVIVVDIIAGMGTIFTGIFGMIACCRGLGRLLHQQEQMLMEARFPQPQITVRPI